MLWQAYYTFWYFVFFVNLEWKLNNPKTTNSVLKKNTICSCILIIGYKCSSISLNISRQINEKAYLLTGLIKK